MKEQDEAMYFLMQNMRACLYDSEVTFRDQYLTFSANGAQLCYGAVEYKSLKVIRSGHVIGFYDLWRECPTFPVDCLDELADKTKGLGCCFQVNPNKSVLVRPKVWHSELDSDPPKIVKNKNGYTIIRTNTIKLSTTESSEVANWVISEMRQSCSM